MTRCCCRRCHHSRLCVSNLCATFRTMCACDSCVLFVLTLMSLSLPTRVLRFLGTSLVSTTHHYYLLMVMRQPLDCFTSSDVADAPCSFPCVILLPGHRSEHFPSIAEHPLSGMLDVCCMKEVDTCHAKRAKLTLSLSLALCLAHTS